MEGDDYMRKKIKFLRTMRTISKAEKNSILMIKKCKDSYITFLIETKILNYCAEERIKALIDYYLN